LQNGMRSWSEHLEPIKIGDLSNGGAIYQFVRLGKGCLSYLVEVGNEAIVIDPVRTIEPILDFAKERGLTIKHVLDTHLHADHISGDVRFATKQVLVIGYHRKTLVKLFLNTMS